MCLFDTGSQVFRNGTRNARRVRSTCRQTVLDGPGNLPIWLGSGSFRARDQQRLISSARRQIRGSGAVLVVPPQCDLRSQQYVCQVTSLNAHRNQIADFVGLDLESGGGSRARICDESQGDI